MQKFIFLLILLSLAGFRSPNANSYHIYLDQKEVITPSGMKEKVYDISTRKIKNSRVLSVSAFICGYTPGQQKTALVIKDTNGKEIKTYTSEPGKNIEFSAQMPANDLLQLAHKKVVELYLHVYGSNQKTDKDLDILIAKIKLVP